MKVLIIFILVTSLIPRLSCWMLSLGMRLANSQLG